MSVVYYSILQNITATSRGYLTVIQATMQYECQPSLSVVYYSILQTRPADSRIAGWYPRCIVVYYSILRTGSADTRIAL